MVESRKISDLFIYPVKSLAGLAVPHAEVTEWGFHMDRRWMLVDKDGVFITQRKYPGMALLKVELGEGGLTFYKYNDKGDEIFVPFYPQHATSISVQVWSDHCKATVLSAEANEWFSNALGVDCKLVYMDDDVKRIADTRYSPVRRKVSFADGFQFLLVNEKSMDNLNARMSENLPIIRFRPNIVFKGKAPFEEDNWKKIRIGNVVFHVVKPCARCAIPTIDPETGRMSKEPLASLAKYRKQNGKILFGQNMVPDNYGTIKNGDLLEVIETKS